MAVTPIDLEHDGLSGAISAWLVTGDEPAVVDPGPATTLEALEAGLVETGVALRELRWLVLTHVHLDHAGAAGELARRVPGLRIAVHEEGAPHMASPERLVASTRRTFGEAHDRLWGEVLPVPRDRLLGWRPGERGPLARLRPFSTPGHIGHHVAWLDETTGDLLAGDAMGIVLDPAAPTHPPTPPPTVDLAAWRETLARVEDVGPERVGVAHFGLHGDVPGRVAQLRERLEAVEDRVREALRQGAPEEDAERYEEEVRAEQGVHVPRGRVDRYFDTFRAATDWAGVRRYVEKSTGKKEGA